MSKVLLRERASQICVTNPRYSKSIKEKKNSRGAGGRCATNFPLDLSPLNHNSTVSVVERY